MGSSRRKRPSLSRSPNGRFSMAFQSLVISLMTRDGVLILMTIFSFNENNLCSKFYSIHWCRGTSSVNGFGFDSSVDNYWIYQPFRLNKYFGKIWRKLKMHRAKASMIAPLWTSRTRWHLIAHDATHLSEFIVDWM